jgi:hypothetical protein
VLTEQDEDYVLYRTKKVLELRKTIIEVIPVDVDPAVLVICFAALIEQVFEQKILDDNETKHSKEYIRDHLLGES